MTKKVVQLSYSQITPSCFQEALSSLLEAFEEHYLGS